MTSSGPALYYDGMTSAQHPVTVELGAAALKIVPSDGGAVVEWPYAQIEALSAPARAVRLGLARNPVLARLEIRDPDLIAAVRAQPIAFDTTGRIARAERVRVVAWSLAAILSLLAVAIFAVPEIATRLAAVLPYGVERWLGAAVDKQVRNILDEDGAGAAFECGKAEAEKTGRADFDKLVAELERAAVLPGALRVLVVRRSDSNAITLPGGTIYVFKGLIDDAKTPDELAGVLAHEFGHVVHRDGSRAVLQGAGVSFLFGLLLGDFVGGGAVILAARAILQTSYSREVEAAADAYSVELMRTAGGDARALATILLRIAGTTHPGPRILLDHPDTQKRAEAINAMALEGPSHPLLSEAEWSNVKHICAGS